MLDGALPGPLDLAEIEAPLSVCVRQPEAVRVTHVVNDRRDRVRIAWIRAHNTTNNLDKNSKRFGRPCHDHGLARRQVGTLACNHHVAENERGACKEASEHGCSFNCWCVGIHMLCWDAGSQEVPNDFFGMLDRRSETQCANAFAVALVVRDNVPTKFLCVASFFDLLNDVVTRSGVHTREVWLSTRSNQSRRNEVALCDEFARLADLHQHLKRIA